MDYMSKAKAGTNPAAGAHGGGVRGDQLNRGSRVFEGRFGRMFRALPAAYFGSADLEALANAMSADAEEENGKPAAAPETDNRIQDGEENTGISAGYTYLGQFIDHDITFDPASSLQKRNDPDALIDFRTPALDLDCLYGRGPDDQPYMFDASARKFILGEPLSETPGGPRRTFDVPRLGERQRAVIGDKRNDENVIVSQLQSVFLQFHNRIADDNRHLSFSEVQRVVRWHYQYVVLHDYLPRIVGKATMDKVWRGRLAGNVRGNEPSLCFYHFHNEAYMPIEFAAAAYRFGHSMVRPIYRLNAKHKQRSADDNLGLKGRFFIFAGVKERGLNGFGLFPRHWAIDWSLFFDINGSGAKGDQPGEGKLRVQPAYKIDSSIVNPLAFLPEFSKAPAPPGTPLTLTNLKSTEVNHSNPSNLAIRNLWRGNAMGLPSGQDVARAMGETPLADDELLVGKAQLDDNDKVDAVSIRTIANGAFNGKAPLWYYILAEANAQWVKAIGKKKGDNANQVPTSLGPVGGRIVAETLIGLMLADSHSFLNQFPQWQPEVPSQVAGNFTMGDFVKYALKL